MLTLFLKGLIIGLAIAAPVGPIGILCIQRSLYNGFKIGLMTGLGAASADGVYGLIAGFGLTAISSLLLAQQFWIRLFGGLFLLYLGIKLLITTPHEKPTARNAEKSALHAYTTTFFLTLANPMTILSFAAILAGLGLGTVHQDYIHAVLLVLGIILGSTVWWLVLSSSVALILHRRMSHSMLRIVNWTSGLIILAFGIFVIL